MASAGAALALALQHPVSPMLALCGLCLWGVLSAWRPHLWLWALPALAPALNGLPWTGWVMVDELDLLVLATLAGACARRAWIAAPSRPAEQARPGWPEAWLAALALTGLLALARGLLDAGAFAFDPYAHHADAMNSLRVAKGLFWALLLWPLLRAQHALDRRGVQRRVAAGMVGGLAVVALASLWERLAFVGLLDFSAPYRTVALFWEMHVGGAAIDAYLALATPFLVWALRSARHPGLWAALAVLAVLVGYSVLTTFARGVYLAVALPLAFLGLTLWLQHHARQGRNAWRHIGARIPGWRLPASLALVAVLALEVVGVLEGGSFMAQRLADAGQDLGSRMQHWKNGLTLLQTPGDHLLGLGLGRLPARYAAQTPGEEFPGEARHLPAGADSDSAPHRVRIQGPATQPALGGVFELAQRVTLVQPQGYQVRLRLRVTQATRLELFLCERHLLYDRACQAAYVQVHPTTEAWQTLNLPLRGEALAANQGLTPRLALFSISVVDAGGSAEFSHISLRHALQPRELLRNPQFAHGLAHWFPSVQSYFLPWHLDNLYLELWVERGLLGLGVTLGLLAWAAWHLVRGRARQQTLAPYLAASLLGVALVGLVSSVMDAPRVALLFWLIVWLSVESSRQPAQADPGVSLRSPDCANVNPNHKKQDF